MIPATTGNQLRPLRLGEILDRAIRLYRRHFIQMIGIVAVVQIPLTLLQLVGSLLTGQGFNQLFASTAASTADLLGNLGPGYAAGTALSGLATLLSYVLVQGVATAAITRLVADSYLGHMQTGVRDAYRRIRGDWLPLVIALLVTFLLAIGIFIWWIFIPCIGWITGGGMLLFLGWVIFPLQAPVIVLEKQTVTLAWRRAWNLARQRFWWLIGFALILYLFNYIVVGAPSTIIAALGLLTFGEQGAEAFTGMLALQAVVQAMVTLMATLLYLPLQISCFILAYFDLRVRYEGLDMSLAALDTTTGQPGPPSDQLPAVTPSEKGRQLLVTGRDMGSFAMLTLIFVGLILGLYSVLLALLLAMVG